MKKEFDNIFGIGNKNDAYAKFFIGQSYLNMLNLEGVTVANVTFEPGCRNNWHIHQASQGGGQILLAVSGIGIYQEWNESPRILKPGDVVYIKPGVKHWHGASLNSWFAHIAIEIPGENASTKWLEAVNNEDYVKVNQ